MCFSVFPFITIDEEIFRSSHNAPYVDRGEKFPLAIYRAIDSIEIHIRSILKRHLRHRNLLHTKLTTWWPKRIFLAAVKMPTVFATISYQFSDSQVEGSSAESFFFCVDAASRLSSSNISTTVLLHSAWNNRNNRWIVAVQRKNYSYLWENANHTESVFSKKLQICKV